MGSSLWYHRTVFFVDDVEKSIDFYERLGFSESGSTKMVQRRSIERV